jgi:putative flippase GtrA
MTPRVQDNESDSPQSPLQHWLGFAVSGTIAFGVDALVLKVLTRLLGLSAPIARIAAISLAMCAGWLAHRRWTFVVKEPPSLAEFLRYVGVAWSAAAVNYVVFVVVLLARPVTEPLAALMVSSCAAMAFAYLGMRFAAFRRRF